MHGARSVESDEECQHTTLIKSSISKLLSNGCARTPRYCKAAARLSRARRRDTSNCGTFADRADRVGTSGRSGRGRSSCGLINHSGRSPRGFGGNSRSWSSSWSGCASIHSWRPANAAERRNTCLGCSFHRECREWLERGSDLAGLAEFCPNAGFFRECRLNL